MWQKIALGLTKVAAAGLLIFGIGTVNRNVNNMNENMLMLNGYDPKTGQKIVPTAQQKVPIFNDNEL